MRYTVAGVRGMGGMAGPIDEQDLGSNGQPIVAEDFFIYELDFPALVFQTSVPGNLLIDAQSDFLWQKGQFFADVAGAAQTDSSRIIPLCSILITDGTSQRQLMSSASPVPSLFGTGQLPFILPNPRVFSAQQQVQVVVANFSAGTTYNLRLQFVGLKRFLGSGQRIGS